MESIFPIHAEVSDLKREVRNSRKKSFSGENKRKRRRHVPHNQQERSKVQRRNERERQRIQAVNGEFVRLRKLLPYGNSTKRVSKEDILKYAIHYIEELSRLISEHDEIENRNIFELPSCRFEKAAVHRKGQLQNDVAGDERVSPGQRVIANNAFFFLLSEYKVCY